MLDFSETLVTNKLYRDLLANFEDKKKKFLFDCSDSYVKEKAKELVSYLPDLETQLQVSESHLHQLDLATNISFC
jgi:hypothetical protein